MKHPAPFIFFLLIWSALLPSSCTFQVDATDYVTACESGFTRCFSNRVEVCSNSGDLFLVAEDCGEDTCVNAQCVPAEERVSPDPTGETRTSVPSPREQPSGGETSQLPTSPYIYPGLRLELSVQITESLTKGYVDVGFCGDGFNGANTPSFCADGVFVRVQDLGGGLQALLLRAENGEVTEIEGGLRILEKEEILRTAWMFIPPSSEEEPFAVSINLLGGVGTPGVIPSVNMLQKELVWFGLWNLEAIEADEAAIEGLVSNASLTVGEEISLELTDLNAGITQSNGQWRIAESGFTAEFYFSNSAPGFALYPLHELLSPAASED